MSSNDKKPDRVDHNKTSGLPFMPYTIDTKHETKIHKDGETYTGWGDTEEEANKNAGEKYSNGEKD